MSVAIAVFQGFKTLWETNADYWFLWSYFGNPQDRLGLQQLHEMA